MSRASDRASDLGSEDGFDWAGLLHAGCHELGLKPWEFWCLTPAELELLIGRTRADGGIGRARLDELARLYPDSKEART